MSTTMRAAVLHAPGDLRWEEISRPTDLADDEVLIKVIAAGICGSDIDRVMTTGTYRFPTVPGHEFAGIVEGVGKTVTGAKPGDPVAVAPLLPCFNCEACRRGTYSLCEDYDFLGSRSDGAFAQFVRAPERNVLKLPPGMDLRLAATIEPAAIILHGIQKVDLSLGDAVAVVGIGALGFFAIQFAKLSGAYPVVAIDIDDGKLELAAKAGADILINPIKQNAVDAIGLATDGKGVALAIDCAGTNAARELCILAARKQGVILLYGSAHHEVTFKPAVFERILRQELIMRGSWNSYSVPFPGKEWFDIIALIRDEKLLIEPLITHVHGIEDAPDIFRKLAARSFGPYNKIILSPQSEGPTSSTSAA